MSKVAKVCKRGQMKNPYTKRCISRNGTVASQIRRGTYKRSSALSRYNRRTSSNRKSRPSPSRSAALERIDTHSIGGNGKVWVVRKRSTGVKFWAPLK